MIPLILAAVGGYFIADSIKKEKSMADGGYMAESTNNELAQYIIHLSNEKENATSKAKIDMLNKDIEEVKQELRKRKNKTK
jgi:hypothetical protein